jgi:dephospho-CoA kinase
MHEGHDVFHVPFVAFVPHFVGGPESVVDSAVKEKAYKSTINLPYLRTMKQIGLTGGIGCGKSYVAKLFRELGIPVYEADSAARRLQENDPQLIAAMKNLFGAEAYLENGKLNSKTIGAQVFADAEKMKQLNALVHPAVKTDFKNWINAQHNVPFILKEAAILFESGTNEGLDAVIVVTAPENLRIRRVMARDKISEADVQKRMAAQWPEAEKIKRATFVIHNDEQQLLLPQVLAALAQLS